MTLLLVPATKTPIVSDHIPETHCLAAVRSPKSAAVPPVPIVKKSITLVVPLLHPPPINPLSIGTALHPPALCVPAVKSP